jgi:hypothetical protein
MVAALIMRDEEVVAVETDIRTAMVTTDNTDLRVIWIEEDGWVPTNAQADFSSWLV